MKLVVVLPFGAFARGDEIVDPDVVAAILAGPNAHCVRRVGRPDAVITLGDPADAVAPAETDQAAPA